MTPPTEKKRPPDYQEFIRSLELYMIALTESWFKINRDDYWKDRETERNTTYKVEAKPTEIGDEYFEIRCTLTLDVKAEKEKTPVVHIVASYDLHLHSSAISKDYVHKFCQADVLLLVIPYFREFVTDITGKMYIPPIVLPLSTKGN
jgi:preprotein translocase subunit SecB